MAYNILKCRYSGCTHGGVINKSTDEYVMHGKGMYYHKDCFEAKKKTAYDDAKTKDDLIEFRKLWFERIDKTVVWWKLNKVIQEYLQRGIPADYLLFSLRYVIVHGFKLNYPAGFRYYLDKQEIKDAYKSMKRREKAEEEARNRNNIIESKQDTVVPFKVPKRKKLEDLFK